MLRNIVEVIEEGILVKIWWKKRVLLSAEDIKSEKEKLRPSKGVILDVTKENLQLTSDTRTILMRYCFMTFSSWINLVDGECLTKGDKSRKMMEFSGYTADLQKLINWPRDHLNLWKCLYKDFFWAYQMTVRTKVVVTSLQYWRTSQYLDFIMNLKGMMNSQLRQYISNLKHLEKQIPVNEATSKIMLPVFQSITHSAKIMEQI